MNIELAKQMIIIVYVRLAYHFRLELAKQMIKMFLLVVDVFPRHY